LSKLAFQLDLGENTYDPRKFVEAVIHAEAKGFDTTWFGDHFCPWFHSGDRSAFAWSVMSSALERTSSIKIGSLVTPPIGGRYHPAIVAQASATLDNLYPGRFRLGVGTGEALNERPFWNDAWPNWKERMGRLTEGIELIRKLWKSKEPFSFKGKYFASNFYFLYTKPRTKIPIYFSAVGKRSSYYAGFFGDKLVTTCPRNNLGRLRSTIYPAYQKGVREAKKKISGVVLLVSFSFSSPVILMKKNWRTLGSMKKDSWSLKDPILAEKEGKKVSLDDLDRNIHFCKNWSEVRKLIEEYAATGPEAIILFSEANKKRITEFYDNLVSVF
jgi:coenzyme F420-dependent glucose-6-phosphate dehydrogenase